jgi:ATP-binding cassette subfamily C protein
VGPSGVGKSTLIDLLVGLAPPDRGGVRLGGVPLGHMAPARLRRLIALVPQEAYVFAGTLGENLTYLRRDATAADLDRAARETGLLPVVERLGGYVALLGGDYDLSAGERQLVVLTRVWLSPAVIVVLDESTCHLDPAAEARAELAFRRRPGTLVVVAHRISSARRADRVLLMDGTTVRVGSHRDLLSTSTLYGDLVAEWRR